MFNFKYNPSIVFQPQNFSKYANTTLGRRIWIFLYTEEVVKRMAYFVDARVTPVEAIDGEIDKRFGAELKKLKRNEFHKYKQMVGKMIRAILEGHGYQHFKYGYRVRDGSVFVLGSKYVRRNN